MNGSVRTSIHVISVNLLLLGTAASQPTSRPLFSAGEDTLGNPIEYSITNAAEISGAIVTLNPGQRTGWHRHPVPTFGYLLSGELTVEYATGELRVFQAGTGLIEAQHVAHNGYNDGDEPVEMLVFNAGARGVPASEPADPPRPANFVNLQDFIAGIQVELRYFGSENFIGRPVTGYEAGVAWLTEAAALALRDVQRELATQGLGLKVYDAYRPQRAVEHFMRWAADAGDTAMKADYYPGLEKSVLIAGGYIAERSGHSRGSTVDVTLIELSSGAELDMGSPWDFFDPISWPSSDAVPQSARDNRMLLREVMLRHGFAPLEEEWWHFTLREEPHPQTYFDFPVR